MNYISNSYLELSKDILLYHPKSIIIDVKKDNLSIGFSTSNEMPFHEYQLRFDKIEAKKDIWINF